MVNIDTDLKRWTIYDSLREKIYDISDNDFNLGIISQSIKLTGKFIELNNNKIWVDGILIK